MKIQYFDDPDTLYIEFRDHDIAETRDLDENTTLDVDADGNVLAITFEHASTRTDISQLTLEGTAARPGGPRWMINADARRPWLNPGHGAA